MPSREVLSAGRVVDECKAENLKAMLADIGNQKYDFLVTYVTHPRCCIDIKEIAQMAHEKSGGAGYLVSWKQIDQLLPPIGLPDIALSSNEWSRLVVGRISPWIDPDSSNPYIRRLSEKALNDELRYFAYLSLPAVCIPLRKPNNTNMARLLSQHLTEHPNSLFAVWIEVAMVASNSVSEDALTNGIQETSVACASINLDGQEISDFQQTEPTANEISKTTWDWFYEFRRSCNNHRRISLVLELTADLPESVHQIDRWKGEPLAAIKLNTRTFLTNKNGFPVLSQAHQKLAKEFFGFNLQCLIDGPTLHTRRLPKKPDTEVDPTSLYHSYMDFLWKNTIVSGQMAEWASGYEDYLQVPLQPLGDHLESVTYDTFEKDPVKYDQYQKAFEMVLEVKSQALDRPVVVMVLGAGRGPLVQVCYETLKKRRVPFKLLAIEKNPCAIITLNTKRVEQWNNEVEIVFTDMRNYVPNEKADIIVSELLGSFGDNELSPECLDGALHLMHDDCISIPSSYCSYISPIHSPKLFNEVRSSAEKEFNPIVGFESPYVVSVCNRFEIARPKQLFRFDHPNWTRSTNDRYRELVFTARESAEMIGVAGYFYADLCTKVSLSTVSGHESSGLFSWFPILFSLHSPIFVKKDQTIRIRFWRCSNEHQVWYEWQVAEPVVTAIMNSMGRSYAMRLY